MVWNNGNCPVHWAIKCWPGANEAAVTSWKWQKETNFAYLFEFAQEEPESQLQTSLVYSVGVTHGVHVFVEGTGWS